MENSHSASYAAAGVNIEAGYEGVRLMKKHVERTMIPGVVSDIDIIKCTDLCVPNVSS